MRHPQIAGSGRGLLLLMSPVAGVSELLRQGYDEIFNQQQDIVPILFKFTRSETTAVSAAIEFLNTFLLQYVAFSRNEPALTGASLTLNDLAELAPARDLDWIRSDCTGSIASDSATSRALVILFQRTAKSAAHQARLW